MAGQRDEAGAGGEKAEGGGEVREGVGGKEADPLSRLHALGAQERGDALRLPVQAGRSSGNGPSGHR